MRSFVIKIINRDGRLQGHSVSRPLVAQQLPNQRIYSEVPLRNLPPHPYSAAAPARGQRSEAREHQQAILVPALELSRNPSPRNRRQVLEREYLGQPLVHLNSNSNNNSNNLQPLVPSGSHSSQPQLGPVSLVPVVHLGSRTSPPLASGVVPSGQQQAARSVLQEPLDNQPASLLQVPQAFLVNPNSSSNLQLGAHSVVLVRTRLLPSRRFSVHLFRVAQRLLALARLAISSSSNPSSNPSSRKRVVYSGIRAVACLARPNSSNSNLNRLGYLVPPQLNLQVAYLEVRRVEVYLGMSHKINSRPNSLLNRVGFLGPNRPLAGVYLEIRLVRRERREQ